MNNPSLNTDTNAARLSPLVMLVDDCEIDNYVNNKMLNYYGFTDRVLTYESPIDAFEYLKNAEMLNNEIPSLLFLDLNMPIIDGAKFVEKFNDLPASVKSICKIVILSSSSNPMDKSKMLNNKHVLTYVSKPLIKGNLEEISSILKRKGIINVRYQKQVA